MLQPRAWIEKYGEMVEVQSVEFSSNTVGGIFSISFYNECYGIEAFLNGYILMANTGLEDKNGTPIYEGDIMRGCAILDAKKEVVAEVIRNVSGWVCNGSLSMNHHIMEVIGNKYENPELLENI